MARNSSSTRCRPLGRRRIPMGKSGRLHLALTESWPHPYGIEERRSPGIVSLRADQCGLEDPRSMRKHQNLFSHRLTVRQLALQPPAARGRVGRHAWNGCGLFSNDARLHIALGRLSQGLQRRAHLRRISQIGRGQREGVAVCAAGQHQQRDGPPNQGHLALLAGRLARQGCQQRPTRRMQFPPIQRRRTSRHAQRGPQEREVQRSRPSPTRAAGATQQSRTDSRRIAVDAGAASTRPFRDLRHRRDYPGTDRARLP